MNTPVSQKPSEGFQDLHNDYTKIGIEIYYFVKLDKKWLCIIDMINNFILKEIRM